MKTLNYVKILLLCVFTIGLASCGDDVYYKIGRASCRERV